MKTVAGLLMIADAALFFFGGVQHAGFAHEFGTERVKQVLQAMGTRDPKDISNELRACVLAHGEQRDDQTILLIRRVC